MVPWGRRCKGWTDQTEGLERLRRLRQGWDAEPLCVSPEWAEFGKKACMFARNILSKMELTSRPQLELTTSLWLELSNVVYVWALK